MPDLLKSIVFRGSALDDLRIFPEAVRQEAGYQLDKVQRGLEPNDCKPMNTVGPEVYGKSEFGMPAGRSGSSM
jgi:phage-related protein